MPNEQNLIKNEDLTPNQRRANASKAGKASGEARRAKKAIKQQLELLLSLPTSEVNKAKLKKLGIDEDNIDNQMALVVSLYQTALKGGKNSVQAFELIRDTVGEKPKDKVEVSRPATEITEEIEQYIQERMKAHD